MRRSRARQGLTLCAAARSLTVPSSFLSTPRSSSVAVSAKYGDESRFFDLDVSVWERWRGRGGELTRIEGAAAPSPPSP